MKSTFCNYGSESGIRRQTGGCRTFAFTARGFTGAKRGAVENERPSLFRGHASSSPQLSSTAGPAASSFGWRIFSDVAASCLDVYGIMPYSIKWTELHHERQDCQTGSQDHGRAEKRCSSMPRTSPAAR